LKLHPRLWKRNHDPVRNLDAGEASSQGRTVEQGRHQDLFDAGNQYSRMWQSYTAGHAKEWEVAR
jgi:hypothetical protein